MKNTFRTILATILFSLSFYAVNRRDMPAGMSDFRDAPKDTPAFDSLDRAGASGNGPVYSAPSPVPFRGAAPGHTAKPKEWTVMVYMDANNDLSEFNLFSINDRSAQKDLAEMREAGTTDAINVVVEIDLNGKYSRRMLVGKKGALSANDQVFAVDPGADMGDYRRAIDFIKTAKAGYPAKKYMFVLWGHGQGWRAGPNLNPNAMPDAAKNDGSGERKDPVGEETKKYISASQLGEIFRQSGYVDVFIQAACAQQMAEVAYEVKDGVGLIAASEEVMLAGVFDYTKLLDFMNGNPSFTNEQFSDFLMSWYRRQYAEGAPVGPINVSLAGEVATLSTLRPAALNELPAQLDAFVGTVMRNNERHAVYQAVYRAIRFHSPYPTDTEKQLSYSADLYDFADAVGIYANSPATTRAADALKDFIKNRLVMGNIGIGRYGLLEDYEKVGGVAIELTPRGANIYRMSKWTVVSETKYSSLALSRASRWDEFLSWADNVWRENMPLPRNVTQADLPALR